jgi:HEAT repeat protein
VAPQYDGDFASHLPGAQIVEERLKAALVDHGKYNFRSLRGDVKRPVFRAAVQELIETSGELVFYYYGHGMAGQQGAGIFVTSDAVPFDEGVPMAEVVRALFSSPAREVVVLLDCCHAGLAAVSADDRAMGALGEGAHAGRVLIAGCDAHQKGWIGTDAERAIGAFSWHVLGGLEGKAKRERATYVRGSDVANHVTDTFSSWNQNPVATIKESGDRTCIITSGFNETQARVDDSMSRAGRATARVLGMPFMPSQTFVGRDAELETLKRTLIDSPRAIAVSATVEGLGGVGKTEIVIQLLGDAEVLSSFCNIVWLDAAGPLAPQWEKIGESIGISVSEKDQQALVQAVAQRLRVSGRTLLVLDNASEWTPQDGLVPLEMSLLVTTRTRGFGGASFRHLELDVLSDEAAEQFMLAMVPALAADKGLRRLLSELDGHALALEIAAGAIDALGIDSSEYLKRIGRQKPLPQDLVGVVKHGRTVDDCLNVTWSTLRRDSARALWRRASLFAPTSAHRELLRVSFVGDEDTRRELRYLNDDESDSPAISLYEVDDFDEAYAELRRRNVFSRVEGAAGERWSMHRLVREFGRRRIAGKEYAAHAMAISEWLRNPTLELQPEVPHIVATILDSAKYSSEISTYSGRRRISSEIYHRGSSQAIFNIRYIVDFLRQELRDPRAISLILQGLTDVNEDVRKQAIVLLENFANIPEVVDGVISALDDPDPHVRDMAARTISSHGTSHVVEILGKTLCSSNLRAKVEAIKCLSTMGEGAIPALTTALSDPFEEIRFDAAIALAGMGIPVAVELIAAAATQSEHAATRAAALASPALKGELGLDLRIAALSNPIKKIRLAALESVGIQSMEDARQALESYWNSTSKPRGAREDQEIVAALKQGIAASFAPNVEIASELIGSGNWSVREAIAKVLQFVSGDATDLVVKALQDSDSDVQTAGIKAAVALLDPSLMSALTKLVASSHSESVKKEAIAAIAALSGRHAGRNASSAKDKPIERIEFLEASAGDSDTAELVSLLAHKRAGVRTRAAVALGKLKVESAWTPVRTCALEDSSKGVRKLAGTALLRLRCGAECATATFLEKTPLMSTEELVAALDGQPDDSNVCSAMLDGIMRSLAVGSSKGQAAKWTEFAKKQLKSDSWESRQYAIVVVAAAGGIEARDSFVELLTDSQAEVRKEAVRALTLLGGADHALLAVSASDSDASIRALACAGLASLQ